MHGHCFIREFGINVMQGKISCRMLMHIFVSIPRDGMHILWSYLNITCKINILLGYAEVKQVLYTVYNTDVKCLHITVLKQFRANNLFPSKFTAKIDL